jgi:predicted O-methyltransferase YrrM
MNAPALVDGWMGKKGRRWLAKRARESRRLIEVGVWKGRSTLTMAEATRGRIWAVDTWAGVPGDESQQHLYAEVDERGEDAVYDEFRANLKAHIRSRRVIPVRMDSVAAARKLLAQHGRVFDFVFIDADHSYQGARGDIEAYLPLVRAGGMLAGHDYHWPGVAQAVTELLAPHYRVKLGPRSIWSVRV